MPIVEFPPLSESDEQGLLAVGGDLHPKSLILAYKQGIFPWPISDDYPLAWFSPDPRGVLDVEDVHVPSRLRRYFKKLNLSFRYNQNFSMIVSECAKAKRSDHTGTWITDDIIQSYTSLFQLGHAYCLGAYQNDHLVAGIYGTCIGDAISGESMFTKVDNGSKICLLYLMKSLELAGLEWLDTQMVTPVVQSLGGKEIPRENFVERLSKRKDVDRSHIFVEHDELF